MMYIAILLCLIIAVQSFTLSPSNKFSQEKFATRRNMVECAPGEFDLNVIEQSSKSLVIVDFYAEWCGPCKVRTKYLRRTATLKTHDVPQSSPRYQLVSPIFKALSEELTDIKFVKVDTDLHEDRSKPIEQTLSRQL